MITLAMPIFIRKILSISGVPNFLYADSDNLLQSFEFLMGEIQKLLAKNLPMPAYEQCVKATHIFNLLEARGRLGVSERNHYVMRIRGSVCECATMYKEQYRRQKSRE